VYTKEELLQLLAHGLLDKNFLINIAKSSKKKIDQVALFHNLQKVRLTLS
jgi:hypothetical protein